MEYSPTLADKKALDTRQMDLEEIAEAIVEMLCAVFSGCS